MSSPFGDHKLQLYIIAFQNKRDSTDRKEPVQNQINIARYRRGILEFDLFNVVKQHVS